VDAPRGELVEQRANLRAVDAAEVEPVREGDEVACEAVAADVRALPDAVCLRLYPQLLVDRPAVPRAAAITLPVRADDEERLAERRRGARRDQRGEVDVEQLAGVAELEPVEDPLALLRDAEEACECRVVTPLGAADEEQARPRQRAQLSSEVPLDGVCERAGSERAWSPRATVLERQPVVDVARRGVERLAAVTRRLGAERPLRHSSTSTQIVWPVVTGSPAPTVSSVTSPSRGARTSFSIFMASMMQSTSPASTA
jgi:hypothetical protein